MGTKQIVRVLESVEQGAFTSDQVAAMTGLSVATASAWLSALCEDGLIKRTHRYALGRGPGRRFHRYEAA
jgi:predicted transcriptional regulator